MSDIFSYYPLLLLVSGCIVGAYSVVLGGGFFFAVPIMQFLFPTLPFGSIVGNLKVGALSRGVASTIGTRKHIQFRQTLPLLLPLLLGTLVGVSVISKLDQRWLLPALLLAIVAVEQARKLSVLARGNGFWIGASALGLYAGFFGAGFGVMIVALMRLRSPEDAEIAQIKIDARFVEVFLTFFATAAHLFHGNLILGIWLWWSLGSFAGGIIGAKLLTRLRVKSGAFQKAVLRLSYVLALVVALTRFVGD